MAAQTIVKKSSESERKLLTKLLKNGKAKSLIGEANKLLAKYPHDTSVKLLLSVGLALSDSQKGQASNLLKTIFHSSSSITTTTTNVHETSGYVMGWEDLHSAILACNLANCNNILGQTIINYLRNAKITTQYPINLYCLLIDNLMWSLEFAIAKQILMLIKPQFPELSEFIDSRIILIVYIELLHFHQVKDDKKHKTCLKVLENKLRKNLMLQQSSESTDTLYMLASLCYESENFNASSEFIKKVEEMYQKNDTKANKMMQNHNIYGFTISFKSKDYEKALHYVKDSLNMKVFDANLIELIFELKTNDKDDSSPLIVSQEFIADVKELVNEFCQETDDEIQFKLLFEFNQALFNLTHSLASSSSIVANKSFYEDVVRKIDNYFTKFAHKPFCVVDVRYFMTKLYEKDKVECKILLQNFVKDKLANTRLKLRAEYDDEKEWLYEANRYMTVNWMKFFVGIHDSAEIALKFVEESFQHFKAASSSTIGDDSEKMYPFCQLLLLSATLLDYLSENCESGSINLSLLAMALLSSVAQDSKYDSFFMFKIKLHLIADRVGLPGLFPTVSSLEFTETQFDSLFYLFLTNIEALHLITNFTDFLRKLQVYFEKFRSEINAMLSELNSRNISLNYEDYAEFSLKSMKSKNRYMLVRIGEFVESYKNTGSLGASQNNEHQNRTDNSNSNGHEDAITDDGAELEDVNDYSICEVFTPLGEQTVKAKYQSLHKSILRSFGVFKKGFMPFNELLNERLRNENIKASVDQSLISSPGELSSILSSIKISSCSSICSQLVSLLYLHRSQYAPNTTIEHHGAGGCKKGSRKTAPAHPAINYLKLVQTAQNSLQKRWADQISEFSNSFAQNYSQFDIVKLCTNIEKHIASMSKSMSIRL